MNYDSWLADHVAAFNLPADAVSTFMQWQDAFTAQYTEAELRAATKAMILNTAKNHDGQPVLKWADNHRVAIVDAITRVRGHKRHAPFGAGIACPKCKSDGFIEVPHPLINPDAPRERRVLNSVLKFQAYSVNGDGHGTYMTMPVVCDCPFGARVGGNRLTFARYAAMYPNWRAVMDQIEAARAASAEAASKPSKPRKKAGAK